MLLLPPILTQNCSTEYKKICKTELIDWIVYCINTTWLVMFATEDAAPTNVDTIGVQTPATNTTHVVAYAVLQHVATIYVVIHVGVGLVVALAAQAALPISVRHCVAQAHVHYIDAVASVGVFPVAVICA